VRILAEAKKWPGSPASAREDIVGLQRAAPTILYARTSSRGYIGDVLTQT